MAGDAWKTLAGGDGGEIKTVEIKTSLLVATFGFSYLMFVYFCSLLVKNKPQVKFITSDVENPNVTNKIYLPHCVASGVMRIRCKSNGQDYPSDVPLHITKVLELNMTKWELQGLDRVMEPSDFTLGVKGALYPDRLGRQTRLKGRLETNISIVIPSVLALVPEDVRRNVANAILSSLVDNMKHLFIESLVADYSRFKNERKIHN